MGKRPHVLVIDPDDSLLELVCDLFAEDYQVGTAHDALEAADAIWMVSPDLILSELFLPVLTGLELIRIIRKYPEFDPIPIVAVSSYSRLVKNLRAGEVQGILAKPFDIADLSQVVAESVFRKDAGDTPSAPWVA